jgi:hypothetical protein
VEKVAWFPARAGRSRFSRCSAFQAAWQEIKSAAHLMDVDPDQVMH